MSNRTFWTQVTLASILLNMPLARAVALSGLPLIAGVLASCICGVLVLAALDRNRNAHTATMQLVDDSTVTDRLAAHPTAA